MIMYIFEKIFNRLVSFFFMYYDKLIADTVSRCRRNLIAEHFDEAWETSDCASMCDHCKLPREVKMLDLSDYGQKLLLILEKASNMDQRLTGKLHHHQYHLQPFSQQV